MRLPPVETVRIFSDAARAHGELAADWIRTGIAKGFNARTVEFAVKSSAINAAHCARIAMRANGRPA